MKRALFSCVAMLVSSVAFAGGIDLTLIACPGNSGALGGETGPVTTDCANEPTIAVYGTWSPNENLPDLVALDGLLDMNVSPNLDLASFWNVDPSGCAATGLASSHTRPGSGCSTPNTYTATWAVAGAGSAVAGIRRGPSVQRLAFTSYRPTTISVLANQHLFGVQIIFNVNRDLGTTCPGCLSPSAIIWSSATPGTASTPATQLTGPTGSFAGFSNCIGFNGGFNNCAAVPAKQRTWGQLKSLYR